MSIAAEWLAGLQTGGELPEQILEVDRLAIIKYAGASDDYMPQHWDQPFMRGQGFDDVVVHGWLTFAHMCRMVTDWIPAGVCVRGYTVRYHAPFYPGLLRCSGEVEAIEGDQVRIALCATDQRNAVLSTAAVTIGIGSAVASRMPAGALRDKC